MINFRLVRHLWLFLAVAEERHFGRAARRLGMTQPPLTEQIKVLEHALRVKLFDRTPKGVQLTPAGQAILPAVRRLADQLEHLELAVREAASGQVGLLTIGAITSAMLDELPAVIERLKLSHPGVTVSVREIDSADAIPALESGELDLALVRLAGRDEGSIRGRPLKQDRLAVALPATHPLAQDAAVPLAALAEEPFVLFPRALNPAYFDTLMACCHEAGFAPRVLHEARTVASQVAFVGCGQGVALVPETLHKSAPANVVIRPLAGEVQVVTTALAWHGERPPALLDLLLSELGGAGLRQQEAEPEA
ncbi:LysR substrate-binding domain-containing protein [Aeromonas veronii]|uniref:LysR substrate-binding domain-containing protein n=1 Tax=Aeromonas veronii TaxID=654 RepID=UPI0032EAE23D